MNLDVLEQRLRSVPGVLDCSVSAEGVAVVVHPEVDPRLIEIQAQVLLAEAGDRRPLLVVGGMTVGPRVLPSGPPARAPRAGRTGLSPLSLAGFAVLVLALLAVVPIAGRDAGSGGERSPSAAQGDSAVAPPGLGRVPVADEAEPSPVATSPAPVAVETVSAVAGPAEATLVVAVAASVDAGAPGVVHLASAPPSSPPDSLAAPRAAEGVVPPAFDARGKAGKDLGKGNGRGKERRGEVRAAGRGESMAMAGTGPVDRPGRRGYHR